MNTPNNITTNNPITYFKVTKNDINNHKALLPNKLYEVMEQFVTDMIANNAELNVNSPKLYKLEILKNAFLNDKLLIHSRIIKLSDYELQLLVLVNDEKTKTTTCKATFKFQLKEPFLKAS